MLPADVSFSLVGPVAADEQEIVRETLRRAFPHHSLREVASFAEAVAQPPPAGPEILLLPNPRPGEIAQAVAAHDAQGWPRWMIIARGEAPAHPLATVIDVPSQDWTASGLTLALQTAGRLHALQLENRRLRGDLRTIGRRLAHDLRTPLNCINSASEGLRETPDDATSTALFTQSIMDAVKEASTLVERLSVVLMATATVPPRQPMSMAEIVWGALQRFETRILKIGATIVQPPAWPPVSGVAALVDLVWSNLIANGLQHAGARPRIELGWHEADGEHRFWVRDSGNGVAPAKRGHLFHPLDRLHELNSPRGYGLAIVHRLVALHGGRCGYDAEPAPAGTFFFTLSAA